jgi:hypothetical protein
LCAWLEYRCERLTGRAGIDQDRTGGVLTRCRQRLELQPDELRGSRQLRRERRLAVRRRSEDLQRPHWPARRRGLQGEPAAGEAARPLRHAAREHGPRGRNRGDVRNDIVRRRAGRHREAERHHNPHKSTQPQAPSVRLTAYNPKRAAPPVVAVSRDRRSDHGSILVPETRASRRCPKYCRGRP